MIVCDRCQKSPANRRVRYIFAELEPLPGSHHDRPSGNLTSEVPSGRDLCKDCWDECGRFLQEFLHVSLPRAKP